MAGGAGHGEAPPVRALLAHPQGQDVAGARGDGHAAVLGDDVIGLDRVGLALHQVAGAVGAPCLLVGHGQIDERAPRAKVAPGEPARGHGHGRGEVEHVDGPASPHDAVLELAPEGIAPPAIRAHGDDIGVAHEEEPRGRRIGALEADDEALTSRLRRVLLARHARAGEVVLEGGHVSRLLARSDRAVVDALVPDERPQELGGFRLDGASITHESLSSCACPALSYSMLGPVPARARESR